MNNDCMALLERIRDSVVNYEVFLVGYSAGTAIIQSVFENLSREHSRRLNVSGGLGVCVCHDYETARAHLESSFVGCMFSYLITRMHQVLRDCFAVVYCTCELIVFAQAYLHNNMHFFDKETKVKVQKVLSSNFLSDFDKCAAVELHGFESEEEYIAAVAVDIDAIDFPLLLLQPSDDPLLQGKFHGLIDIKDCMKNPNVVILETSHGNHFGFYEGPLRTAFSNSTCYTYPAKVALQYFNIVSSVSKIKNK
jgi:predicted alpha/beta-fold hydrolase